MSLKPLRILLSLALVATAGLSLAVPASAAGTDRQASAVTLQASVPSSPLSWLSSATVYEVNVRQFSPAGNFAGVTTALPRLKALGTDVIWLMPIFPVGKLKAKGSLGSPYSVANYEAVNPDFGTDADFKQLVDTAHSLGMKVVLDWVANHTAWDNPWITDHPDWYTKDGQGNITWPAGTDWNDVADLDYSNMNMRAAMTDALKYWVSNFDIDGYRCDTAGMVPTDFWNSATYAVDQIKPLWWLAEDQANGTLLAQAFTSNYNWNLLGALNSLVSSDVIARAVKDSVSNYPAGTYPMNFITNHDENSWNGTEFERLGRAVKVAAAITFVTPGIPLIYNGQEIGMDHRLAFFEKDAINWGANPAASAWTKFYAKLTSLRKNNRALWAGTDGGKLEVIKTRNSDLLGLGRYVGTSRVVLFANLGASAKTVVFSPSAHFAGKYYAYASGKRVTLTKGKTLKIKIPAWGFVIYSSAKS
jgi:glycosidase